MQNVLDFSKRHQRFFEEMTRIPHGSFNEREYSDYLVHFAQERGLQYVQDAMNNVVMYKPASPGYEDHAPVAIQAHIDMVCEKDEGYTHDFTKDPLTLEIKDGYLQAVHTTLGADNGTGVAYILAVLDDPDAKHPPLEAIFTVQEEVGMFGAIALDQTLLSAKRFISLDCGGGDEIFVSSLGGRKYKFTRSISMVSSGEKAWRVSLRGVGGGYATSFLDGAENAIELCTEVLTGLQKVLDIQLVSFQGGNDSGKTAATAEAVFTSATGADEVQAAYDKLAAVLKKEVLPVEPAFSIELTPCEAVECFEKASQEDVLHFLNLLQSGLISRSKISGEIGAVQSWLEIKTENDTLEFTCNLRAESDYKLDKLAGKAEILCTLFGFGIELMDEFPAWEYNPNSPLSLTLKEVFRKRFGREIGEIMPQGGLECSLFKRLQPDLDIITIGPLGEGAHTTEERLQLASFDEIYDVFTDLLSAL